MKANHGKCHLLLRTQEDANTHIANATINCSRSQKVLGIVFDNKLKFDKHNENICQKAKRKLNTLTRVKNCMELRKRRILMHTFFKAQFKYCSLSSNINRLYVSFTLINVHISRNF